MNVQALELRITELSQAERDAERWRTYLSNYSPEFADEMTATIDKQIANREMES